MISPTLAKKLRALAVVALATVVSACTPNPYVTNADRNEVITLGDSIFDLSGEIQMILESYAGETFRDYTLSGAELAGGVIATSVINQYADAKADDANIQTIVMDGGGNDILIPAVLFDPYGCRTHWWRWFPSSACINLIDDVYVDLVDLMNQMDADAVENIIYLGYYTPKGNLSNLKKAGDYGSLRLGQACSNTTANCSFLDPRSIINNADIISDNIHPSSSGSQKLADLIWPELQALL